MGVRKLLLRGLIVAVTGTLPLWISASPASAFESHSRSDIVDHTFIDTAGDEVTCSVEYDASLIRETSAEPFQGEAGTQAFIGYVDGVPDEQRCKAFVGVEIAYQNAAGRNQTARAFGIEFADLQLDEVRGNFVATHTVVFLNCAVNCETGYTTSPK